MSTSPPLVAEVDDEHAFYFRGPHGTMNIPARSIANFLDVAARVDEDVWSYHLVRGDCARWFRDVLCDEALATQAERIAQDTCSASESRSRLLAATGRPPASS